MITYRSKFYVAILALTVPIIISLACGTSVPKTPLRINAATSEKQETLPSDNTVNTIEMASPTDIPIPPPTDTQVPELYLGDAVSNYGYALTALSIQDPAIPGMLYNTVDGKKLISVEVVISNLSGDMLNVNPLNAILLDMEGFTYQTELGGVDNQISTLNLNTGEKVKGMIAFEVPENAIAANIKYALEPFGKKLLKASLTPAPEGHIVIPEPQSTPIDQLPKLGDTVENFGYSLTVISVENPATPSLFYEPKQGGKLVAIEIIIGNVSGSQSLSVNPLNAYLVDNNGFVYCVELGGRDDQINTGDLYLGEKVKGWVAFVIPENATPVSVKYSTEIFSNNYLQTGVTK